MEIFIIIYSVFNTALIFLAFLFGLHYGSKTKTNEIIEKPVLNPIKVIKENVKESKREIKKEKEELIDEINLYNIENYNGTEIGQKDIPR